MPAHPPSSQTARKEGIVADIARTEGACPTYLKPSKRSKGFTSSTRLRVEPVNVCSYGPKLAKLKVDMAPFCRYRPSALSMQTLAPLSGMTVGSGQVLNSHLNGLQLLTECENPATIIHIDLLDPAAAYPREKAGLPPASLLASVDRSLVEGVVPLTPATPAGGTPDASSRSRKPQHPSITACDVGFECSVDAVEATFGRPEKLVHPLNPHLAAKKVIPVKVDVKAWNDRCVHGVLDDVSLTGSRTLLLTCVDSTPRMRQYSLHVKDESPGVYHAGEMPLEGEYVHERDYVAPVTAEALTTPDANVLLEAPQSLFDPSKPAEDGDEVLFTRLLGHRIVFSKASAKFGGALRNEKTRPPIQISFREHTPEEQEKIDESNRRFRPGGYSGEPTPEVQLSETELSDSDDDDEMEETEKTSLPMDGEVDRSRKTIVQSRKRPAPSGRPAPKRQARAAPPSEEETSEEETESDDSEELDELSEEESEDEGEESE